MSPIVLHCFFIVWSDESGLRMPCAVVEFGARLGRHGSPPYEFGKFPSLPAEHVATPDFVETGNAVESA